MKDSLNEFLARARSTGRAIGHFNFSTADVLRAIVQGARVGGAPAVMVGTSESEAEFIGLTEAVALVGALREEFGFPVFLNADHFKTFELCRDAIDAGYDSIIIDASHLPLAENIALTCRVVEYARTMNREISVEGELGYLRGSSEVQKEVHITPKDYTRPQDAALFARETGIDRLAVVFGNIHGIVTDQKESLDINQLKKIITAFDANSSSAPGPNESLTHPPFLVLHGASGLANTDIRSAIEAGISNVHVNTELRVAYAREIEKAIHLETTPYKYLAPAAREAGKIVEQKTRLFEGT